MKQTPQNKWIWLALVVTLALSWEALRHPAAEISQPTRQLTTLQAAEIRHSTPIQTQAPALQITKRNVFESQYNLFATPFAKPPLDSQESVVIKAPPPPPPQAPPLPFAYLGRIKIGDSDGILLNIDGEVSPIQLGDHLLSDQYQVQAIQAKQVLFLYKPLNQVQVLNIP